jgi:hypothetical protein
VASNSRLSSSRLRISGSLEGCRGLGRQNSVCRAAQADSVEELEAVGDDVAGAAGKPSLLQQMQQIALHLGFADLIGAAAVELRQSPHRIEVSLAGAHRHPPQHHVVVHLRA